MWHPSHFCGPPAFAGPLSLRPAYQPPPGLSPFCNLLAHSHFWAVFAFHSLPTCHRMWQHSTFKSLSMHIYLWQYPHFHSLPRLSAAGCPGSVCSSSCKQLVAALALLQLCTHLLVEVFVAYDRLQQLSFCAIGGFGSARSLSLSTPRTAQHKDRHLRHVTDMTPNECTCQ